MALALRVLLGKLEKRLEGESEGTNTLEKDINIYRSAGTLGMCGYIIS